MVPALPRGRPSKFTPTITARVIEYIAAGNFYQPACALAGVSYDTFRDWMRAGEAGQEPFSDFYHQVLAAEAQAEAMRVARWSEHGASDWKADRDFVARRWPDRWADQSRRTISIEGTATIRHEVALPPGDLASMVALLAQAGALGVIDGQAHEVPQLPETTPD